jgi:hypothetical protein
MPRVLVDSSLRRNPKTKELAERMGWTELEAMARLVCLWHWALDCCEDGDLRPFTARRIAGAMEVPPNKAARLLRALARVGWIDQKPHLRLHDWWEHAQARLRKKYSGRDQNLLNAIQKKWEISPFPNEREDSAVLQQDPFKAPQDRARPDPSSMEKKVLGKGDLPGGDRPLKFSTARADRPRGLGDVATEIRTKGYPIEAKHWFEFHRETGWRMPDGTPIKDWRAELARDAAAQGEGKPS